MRTSEILARHGLRPSKGLGQCFLTDPSIHERIADVAELTRDDVVLEVGPGLGSLTRALAERAGQVVAIELDERMLPILDETLAGRDNVRIVHADILEVDPPSLLLGSASGYSLVANLPYYITSAVLRHVLSVDPRPRRLTVMVQIEVARRIVAKPGQMSLLALGVQLYGTPRIAFRVPRGAFYPRPNVDSAVLQVDVLDDPRIDEARIPAFFRAARAGFSQKRKQLHNSLSAGLGLPDASVRSALEVAGVDARRRPQSLSIEEWGQVTEALDSLQAMGDEEADGDER